jgi:hypothetical protein
LSPSPCHHPNRACSPHASNLVGSGKCRSYWLKLLSSNACSIDRQRWIDSHREGKKATRQQPNLPHLVVPPQCLAPRAWCLSLSHVLKTIECRNREAFFLPTACSSISRALQHRFSWHSGFQLLLNLLYQPSRTKLPVVLHVTNLPSPRQGHARGSQPFQFQAKIPFAHCVCSKWLSQELTLSISTKSPQR